jgi:Skp family chaperone for outer membrane proteins
MKPLFAAVALLVAGATFAHGQSLQEEQRLLQKLIQNLLDEGKALPQSLQDEQMRLQKLLDEEKAMLEEASHPLRCAGIPYVPPPTARQARQQRQPSRQLSWREMRALLCSSPSPRAPELGPRNEPDNAQT